MGYIDILSQFIIFYFIYAIYIFSLRELKFTILKIHCLTQRDELHRTASFCTFARKMVKLNRIYMEKKLKHFVRDQIIINELIKAKDQRCGSYNVRLLLLTC